jgi:2-polyprenyl-3-methyl-5-hydroxy-6-metoxy-1,4-benzoquinol methylase
MNDHYEHRKSVKRKLSKKCHHDTPLLFSTSSSMQKLSSIIVQFFEERVGQHYLAVLLHQSTHEDRNFEKV